MQHMLAVLAFKDIFFEVLQVTPVDMDETYFYVTVVSFHLYIFLSPKIWFSSSLGIGTWHLLCFFAARFFEGALLKQKGGKEGRGTSQR